MARTKTGLYFIKTVDGGPPAMDWFDLKGATAYYEGQILRLSATSGSAAKASASGTAMLGVTGANVTSSATTTQMPVYLADPRNVFEARMLATGAPHTRLRDKITFVVGTTHNYRIEGTAYNGAATACLRIIGYNPDDASGTATNKRYWVTFIPNNSLAGGDAGNKV